MRKAVAERIGQDYAQVSRTMIKRQLLDKLADTHKFEVPEGLVEGEFNAIWQRIEEAKKAGQKVDDDEEKMKKEYREIAERRVRLGLLLADVGRSNSIDVTPEELNQAVMREAMRYPGQERQVLEFYGKNAELKERLRAPIFEEKTVDFILELAKVSEKSVTPEELLKAAREAEEAEDEPASQGAGDELIQGASDGLEPDHRRCHFSWHSHIWGPAMIATAIRSKSTTTTMCRWWSSRRRAASAATTSGRGCSRSASSS